MSRSLRIAAYALTAMLLAAYAVVMWWVIHPNVPASYHAYYIDQTTTCMNQPVPGTYTLGTIISYLPDGNEAAKPTKPCGWEGPAGDGTHAVGTSARLRFNWTEAATDPLTLSLDLLAITKAGTVMPQTVNVVVNNEKVATLDVTSDTGQHFDIPLPSELVGEGRADVVLEFPDAVQMGPADPATRWRSIKLVAAGVLPAT